MKQSISVGDALFHFPFMLGFFRRSKIEFLFVKVIFRDIIRHISYFKGAIVHTILRIVQIFQGEYLFRNKVLQNQRQVVMKNTF
jgi:hypothetical protein